jgi:hypothetical protein
MSRHINKAVFLFMLLLGVGAGIVSVRAQQAHTLMLPALYAPPIGNVVIGAAHIDSADG